MGAPRADRPHLPGYGVAAGPTGLLPWSWAEQRLRESHDFRPATVTPAGRPHLMPVWAVWTGEVLWFSSSLKSVKARNIAAGSAVSLTRRGFLDVMNAKYFGLREKDFTATPTRWTFR